MLAQVLITALSLLYAIVCTTVVGALDCRAPGALAEASRPDLQASVMLPQEAYATANAMPRNTTGSMQPIAGNVQLDLNPSQLTEQVLLSFGHNPADSDVYLLMSDPTVVCFTAEAHQIALGLAASAIMFVVVGLPLFLLLWVGPEIERAIRMSPARSRLKAAYMLLKVARDSEAE